MQLSHSSSPKYLRPPSALALGMPASVTHLVPLGPELVHGDSAVGVAGADSDVVALDHLFHLILDGHDGLPLAVRLRQCGLELLVSSDQTLTQRQKWGKLYCCVDATGFGVPFCTCVYAFYKGRNLCEENKFWMFSESGLVHKSQVSWKWKKDNHDD